MKKSHYLSALLMGLFCVTVQAAGTPWKFISRETAEATGPRMIFVTEAGYAQLDLQSMTTTLLSAPMERSGEKPLVMSLPMPDGSFQRFAVEESPVMEQELAAKYPGIHTWSGQGLDDKTATVRMDITQWGFHSMVISAEGRFFIDPFDYYTTDTYILYNADNELNVRSPMSCGYEGYVTPIKKDDQEEILGSKSTAIAALIPAGDTLRQYRLALACTGEYAQSFGGVPTKASTLARMVTSINRVTGVYEHEIAVRLVLIANTDTLIYLDGTTDPYTNNSGSTMLGENQSKVQTVIGNGNYDIGHVFSTGGGGIAGLGVVCSFTSKSQGVTGSPAPYGDAFDIDYVAHEMGHQFGGNHTFNCTTGSCSGNRNASTAYEPGSGTTIMAYAGICGTVDNTQQHSDAFFHSISFDEIRTYSSRNSTGKSCGTLFATGNHIPVITSAPATYTVPKSTPFMLTGSATDADNDSLTYCWEEFDLGNYGSMNSISGNSPTFRSFAPTVGSTRYFPKLSVLLANGTSKGETLPTYARTMHFRMTVRDNKANGAGVIYNPTTTDVTVDANSGPLLVTQPNTVGVIWTGLSTQTITWNVANTDQTPVSCANVDVLLSVDGGNTYPYLLGTAVPNSGSCSITVPNVQTSTARIMVRGTGNIFFDVSNYNHTINLFNAISETDAGLATMQIYPNPALRDFTIELNGPYIGKLTVKLFDLQGRLAFQSSVSKKNAQWTERIELPELVTGTYSLEVSTPEATAVQKLMIR